MPQFSHFPTNWLNLPEKDFETEALKLFRYQVENNQIYHDFIKSLNKDIGKVNKISDIPFLPVSFFKYHRILTKQNNAEIVFESSRTSGQIPSRHFVFDTKFYKTSIVNGFEKVFGPFEQYTILALLPSYLERPNASLVYMVDYLIKKSGQTDFGFYLQNLDELHDKFKELNEQKQKSILIGVSFALLDLAEKHPMKLPHTTIIETGGMKGRRKEIIRPELHGILKNSFQKDTIYSEYGMTELLSQAWSVRNGLFECPPWMKILIRDPYDPQKLIDNPASGAINIIDLANVHSCAFVATDDLGKTYFNGMFEVLGRMDESEIRGCNLVFGSVH
jgi:phenylacetate-coenzyme A ligase PaaK-like adenylate-forming protein